MRVGLNNTLCRSLIITNIDNQAGNFRITRGHILMLPAILMMPLAVMAPKGLAVLFVITAVAVLIWCRNYRIAFFWPPLSMLLPFAAFVGYAIMSSIWSPTPLTSLKSAIVLGLMTFAGIALVSFTRRLCTIEKAMVAHALVAGTTIAIVLLGIEIFTNGAIWRLIMTLSIGAENLPADPRTMVAYNSAMSVGALLIWPLFMLSRGERSVLAFVGIVLAIIIVLASEAETPILAVSLSILAALFYWRVQVTLWVALSGVVVLIIAAPFIPSHLSERENIRTEMPYLSHSAIHRVMIWKVAAKHIAEDPVFGLGMNTTRSLYGQESIVFTTYPPPESGGLPWSAQFEPIPLHPHNSILQIWLELGGVGIAFLLWIILALTRIARHYYDNESPISAIILGFYLSSLVIASLSFGAWQSWWVCSLWLTACLLVSQLPDSKKFQ